MKIKKFCLFMLALLSVGLLACADSNEANLDEARFLMDACIPSDSTTLTNCTAAVTKTTAVLADDPTNVEAAALQSSANLGLSGLSTLSLASQLLGLTGTAGEDFATFNTYISDLDGDTSMDLVALRASITSLKDVLMPGGTAVTATDANKYAFFQLGLLQAIDSFIRPTQVAGASAADFASIDQDVTDIVVEDFLLADDNLVLSDTTDTDFLSPIRRNYCYCSLAAPAGATAGFTTECLQDLMICTLGSAAPQQDYDDSGTLSVADCVSLLAPTGLTACEDTDTN